MDKSEHLEFSSHEKKQIHEFENKLKEEKLAHFFMELLANNELDYINQILHKKIPFYSELKVINIFKNRMEDMSNSIFRETVVKAIENIKNIEDKKYVYIKRLLIKKVIKNVKEALRQGYTLDEMQGSPFHKRTLELGLELLTENPQYIEEFKSINLEEYKKTIQVIELSNKLPIKNVLIKKPKI